MRDGAVDDITTDLAAGLRGADFCVLATPVAVLESRCTRCGRPPPPSVLITDVGSTKGRIVAYRRAARRPTDRSPSWAAIRWRARSGRATRCARGPLSRGHRDCHADGAHRRPTRSARVRVLGGRWGLASSDSTASTHDRAVAAVSHLPHLVADALVDAVLRMDPAFLDVAARGFRDTTRIAASIHRMWREIFQDNRAALAEAVAAFRSRARPSRGRRCRGRRRRGGGGARADQGASASGWDEDSRYVRSAAPRPCESSRATSPSRTAPRSSARWPRGAPRSPAFSRARTAWPRCGRCARSAPR